MRRNKTYSILESLRNMHKVTNEDSDKKDIEAPDIAKSLKEVGDTLDKIPEKVTDKHPDENPKQYYEISNYMIEGVNKRLSKKGKVLKQCFIMGPSKSTISNGKCISIGDESSSQTPDSSKSPDKNTPSTDKSSECFHYSILGAYKNVILEADPIEAPDLAKELSGIKDTTDNKTKDQSKKGTDTKTDSSKESDEVDFNPNQFIEGERFRFKVGIDGEGFTVWEIAFNAKADSANIARAKKDILSFNFKKAFTEAGDGVDTDGIVPLRATTYVNIKQPTKVLPPFVGHCRYGFAAESGDDDSKSSYSKTNTEDSDDGGLGGLNLSLAVAPIDGETKKPNDNIVMQAVYNITGDITGGKVGELLAKAVRSVDNKVQGKSSYDRESEKTSEQSKAEALDKYIKTAFRATGDSTMYKEFVKIRNYLSKQIKANKLEAESQNIKPKSGIFNFVGNKHLLFY